MVFILQIINFRENYTYFSVVLNDIHIFIILK